MQICPFFPSTMCRYQEELPVLIAGRKEKYLTQEELVKLMEWKLSVSDACGIIYHVEEIEYGP